MLRHNSKYKTQPETFSRESWRNYFPCYWAGSKKSGRLARCVQSTSLRWQTVNSLLFHSLCMLWLHTTVLCDRQRFAARKHCWFYWQCSAHRLNTFVYTVSQNYCSVGKKWQLTFSSWQSRRVHTMQKFTVWQSKPAHQVDTKLVNSIYVVMPTKIFSFT